MTGVRRAPRWRGALIVTGAVVVVVAVAGFALVPVVLPWMQTTVAETDRTIRLSAGERTASLLVPAGWSVQRESDESPTVVVRTPDAALALTVDLVPGASVDAVAATAVEGRGAVRVEQTSEGTALAHAEAPGVLVAAVSASDGSASARVIARADPERRESYDAEIAGLLDTVRVGQ